MAKNIKSLQLLRNTTLFNTRELAYNSLSARTADDGTPVLARYTGTDGNIYTLVGYYATANGTSKAHMTIFDFEGSAADVEELKNKIGTGVTTANTVTKQLQDLSGTTADNSATTSVAGAKKYADEKVRAALDALDANSVADDNKIVSDVTQANGKITATTKNVTAVKLAGLSATADTKIAATDTLGTALGKLQGQINGMDKDANAVAGQVVTTVAETDGKVTETKANVKDLQLGGYTKDTAATGAIASADTINTALSKLENKVGANKITNADHSIVVTEPTGAATTTDIKVNIKSGEKVIKLDNDGIYTNLNLVKITTGLGATVKESYEFRDSDGNKIGESINIAKDSHIVSITYDETTQKLIYKYLDASGVEQTTELDMSHLILETEVENGIQSVNGKLSIKLDTTGDDTGDGKFLTVGTNGLKLDGVTDAINAAIADLDATVGTTTIATGKHVAVQVVETNGVLTALTVNESNIADADDLAALSAKTVTEVASSNNSIEAALSAAADGTKHLDIITDASKVKMTGFTADASGFTGITSESTVTEAVKSIETEFLANEATVSAALDDLELTKVENITVNGVEGTFNNKVASVTIDGADIKLDGYASGSSSASVVATDSVNQAIGKLENQVKAAVAGGLQQVKAGSGITVSAVANNKQTIDAKLASAANITGVEENAIKYNSTDKGLYIDYLDCGTY